MTDEQIELARLLVPCEQWRWVVGMMMADSLKPKSPSDRMRLEEGIGRPIPGCWLPDLSDYATVAILLRMAMEIQGVARLRPVTPIHGTPRWSIGETWMDPDLGTAAAKTLLAAWEEP